LIEHVRSSSKVRCWRTISHSLREPFAFLAASSCRNLFSPVSLEPDLVLCTHRKIVQLVSIEPDELAAAAQIDLGSSGGNDMHETRT